ncbi:DnaJ domain-containing protein [Flavihumibacter petaseus]|uniref:J domain-containing protein n=1 Tax=Flavihumibacter petaseus NBRC 106054 TaxID=1220578 RepID=A0A0E9N193_9BACT|nr:DnaJ domain-containing protein [Flavihumibacter petaseus]GAO43629.1 hypothetical protein FPE01S_02_07350 [Flavihumibacter petaseus NBRC 106054]
MPIKDYYALLEIKPGASEGAVKKAFRKLAMRYHPDRNTGNTFAASHFREIQEAYEVLSNPVKRSEYHQQRWREIPSMQQQAPAPTIIDLVSQARTIENYVNGLDTFRMNHQALFRQLEQLLNDHHLHLLQEAPESQSRKILFYSLLHGTGYLPWPMAEKLVLRLVKLAGADNQLLGELRQFERAKKHQYLWDRYKGILMVVVALILCLLIYLLA